MPGELLRAAGVATGTMPMGALLARASAPGQHTGQPTTANTREFNDAHYSAHGPIQGWKLQAWLTTLCAVTHQAGKLDAAEVHNVPTCIIGQRLLLLLQQCLLLATKLLQGILLLLLLLLRLLLWQLEAVLLWSRLLLPCL